MKQKWENYEEVAAHLLNEFAAEFGLKRVEGKQEIGGRRSGTKWEIDAKGVNEGDEGFIIVECRRYTTSKQNQEKMSSLAYRIIDAGADGGIIVSPLGLQKGAQKIANAENIVEVQLDPNSTPQKFIIKFLNKVMAGITETIGFSAKAEALVERKCASCGNMFDPEDNERVCSDCSGK